jgi:hypothetical protein
MMVGPCQPKRQTLETLPAAVTSVLQTGLEAQKDGLSNKKGVLHWRVEQALLPCSSPAQSRSCTRRDARAEWTVAAGELSASERCNICLQQHEMSPTLGAKHVIHLTKSLDWNEVILGSDLLGGRTWIEC